MDTIINMRLTQINVLAKLVDFSAAATLQWAVAKLATISYKC